MNCRLAAIVSSFLVWTPAKTFEVRVDGPERLTPENRDLMHTPRSAALVLFFLLLPALVRAQTAHTEKQSPATQDQLTGQSETVETPASQSEDAETQSKPQTAPADQKTGNSEGQQTKRIFGVVPNFAAVSANTQLPPLSTREKFVLAARDSVVDYSSFTWAGILAGQAMLLNSDPELGHGIVGYGRYYWRTFTDGVSGTFFTEAIIPAITHEDPRYYTRGKGGFFTERATRYPVPSSRRRILEARPLTGLR